MLVAPLAATLIAPVVVVTIEFSNNTPWRAAAVFALASPLMVIEPVVEVIDGRGVLAPTPIRTARTEDQVEVSLGTIPMIEMFPVVVESAAPGTM